MIELIVVFIYLGIMTVYDIRYREIQLGISGVAALVLMVQRLRLVFQGEMPWYFAFGGVLVGFFLIALSICTRGQIGIGDGIVFIISGIPLGIFENGLLLLAALCVAAVAGVFLVACKRMGRKEVFPFVPCVCAAYGVMCLWKIFGQG